jgi:hypothetical protein
MASEQDIGILVSKILGDSVNPDFVKDLIDWARVKYSRSNCGSKLLSGVQGRRRLFEFLEYVDRAGWHRVDYGAYHIIEYLSHGEQAPMPVHIRMILDSDKDRAKRYIKGVEFESS